jgi:hypothetical protein
MKGDHIELLTGVLIGIVVGGMYSAHLGVVLPILVGILGFTFGLKFLGLLK